MSPPVGAGGFPITRVVSEDDIEVARNFSELRPNFSEVPADFCEVHADFSEVHRNFSEDTQLAPPLSKHQENTWF